MNWFDIFILIVVAYSLISGYKSGLIRQLTSLAGFIVAAMISGQISTILGPHIKKTIQVPEYFLDSLSYTVAFIIVIIFFFIVGKMLETIIKSIKMGTLNRLTGSALCLAKWLFTVSIIINIIGRLDDQQQLTKNTQNSSITYKYIQPIAPLIIPYLKVHLQ